MDKNESKLYEDLSFAKVDHLREARSGFPEVVFCERKTEAQVAQIMQSIFNRSGLCLGTRASDAQFQAVKAILPGAEYHENARIITVGQPKEQIGNVAVCTAGTTDIPVAEEAALTAWMCGAEVHRYYDVGVAGLHRLLDQVEEIRKANAIVAVAGMEGALASVIGGLVSAPVVACPTSVGYGANFGGLSALLAMLNSCAAGTAVVNIDNGFGAGFMAAKINRQTVKGAAQ
ncbi:MAG: nickel pincer cofactor biosynthesis protein LarB [Clostridia bacterium]|nr:nickel pincer cofactor biosynthesis protein LarB [Clostridia bacterium]